MKNFALALLLAGSCFAQTPDAKPNEPRFYKLDFVVKDIEGGKTVNSRAYSSLVAVGGKSSIRSGDKVQVPTGGGPGQFTYIDVGVNIDCTLIRADANKVEMTVFADFSGFVSPESGRAMTQMRWNSDVVVPLRKATTVFSSDSASVKRQTQLEITATPVP